MIGQAYLLGLGKQHRGFTCAACAGRFGSACWRNHEAGAQGGKKLAAFADEASDSLALRL